MHENQTLLVFLAGFVEIIIYVDFSYFFLFVFLSISLYLQMNDIVDVSQSSTRELQEQIDIYKEKNRRELTELQKLLKERGQELEKYQLATKTLQEEVQSAMSAWFNVPLTDSSAENTFMVRVLKSKP